MRHVYMTLIASTRMIAGQSPTFLNLMMHQTQIFGLSMLNGESHTPSA